MKVNIFRQTSITKGNLDHSMKFQLLIFHNFIFLTVGYLIYHACWHHLPFLYKALNNKKHFFTQADFLIDPTLPTYLKKFVKSLHCRNQKEFSVMMDLTLLSASQTLQVSIITLYCVHSGKVCRPVAGGGATVAPFCIKWRHHGATLTGNLILTCLAL